MRTSSTAASTVAADPASTAVSSTATRLPSAEAGQRHPQRPPRGRVRGSVTAHVERRQQHVPGLTVDDLDPEPVGIVGRAGHPGGVAQAERGLPARGQPHDARPGGRPAAVDVHPPGQARGQHGAPRHGRPQLVCGAPPGRRAARRRRRPCPCRTGRPSSRGRSPCRRTAGRSTTAALPMAAYGHSAISMRYSSASRLRSVSRAMTSSGG